VNDVSLALIRERPAEHFDRLLDVAQSEIRKAVVGQDAVVETLLIAMLSRGHILFEGPPGTAKTLLARGVARAVGGVFHRVQFTPETSPSEIVGEIVRRGGTAEFEKGPIFCNVFLADEINRGPATTQAALLEAMQERHVTVRGRTYWIDSPFVVVATQNPHEHHGVYPLAESQLDRFLVKIEVTYGSAEDERAMLELPHRGVSSDVIGDIYPFLANGGLLQVQDLVDTVEIPRGITERIVRIVRHTREADGVELGASSRAAMHVLTASKARAILYGRRHVTIDDVEAVSVLVLPHRLMADDPRGVVKEALTC